MIVDFGKIKLLHVHTLPVVSGSGIHALLTLDGLNKDVYEVEFACGGGGPLEDEIKKRGILFRRIKHLIQPVNLYKDIMALYELTRLMKEQKYNIIHTHNSKAGFIGRLAGKLAGVPIVVHTIHGFSFHDFEKPPRQALFTLLERLAASWADILITVSEPLKEWGLRLGIGKIEQYITIYDGIELDKYDIDIDREEKKKTLGVPAGHKVIGVVSKLWEGKGHECVLRAAAQIIKTIPEVTFLFVGEGYLRNDLEGMSQDMGLGRNVIYTGFREDIPEITATFDIALLVSFFEGLGRVLLEAMALAKPVVATRVGGIVDVVDDGVTGILVKPDNSEELAAAIVRLLIDCDLCKKMGQAGKEKINSKFSAETMVNRIEQVYKELLAEKKQVYI
jgi:glycosyltransferase involved in cell wall biosynthesis